MKKTYKVHAQFYMIQVWQIIHFNLTLVNKKIISCEA
jgi:hypothetical protein